MSYATSQRHELKDIETVLIETGREVDDFVVSFLPDPGFREQEILVFANVLRVANKRTSRTHLYSLDQTNLAIPESDWITDFREDLVAGKFD